MDVQDLKFDRADCIVQTAQVEKCTGGTKPPRWGVQAGNVIDGVMGQAIRDDLNAVTVLHQPTGLSATISKFHPARNKELAFIKLERMVNQRIQEMKDYLAKKNAEGKV